MFSAVVGGVGGIGVVGDVRVPAGFTENSTRMGGVSVESTRPAAWWKPEASVLPSGEPLELSRTVVSEESVMSSWRW